MAGTSILSLVTLILAIIATIRCVRAKGGVELILWLLFIWLIPLIGSIIALCVIPKSSAKG